ncbi:MFS transporter [Paucilactobacillus wasatchensis]|uniref:Transmembrane efflux protein n=1 Tax=Paucilactobacillus wasatchensis TaxID=1335616 RepID=A0A0D1A6B9_9LACO|nr:MFS transporter [Paucilactobacillus wasatchensis]KIS03217.1 transmembrane efflux protein [Paucilactobacillus wasatchensis]
MNEQKNDRIDIDNTRKFGIILPIVLISYFLILLNNSLVFTSTVQISRDMHMNSIMIAWVSNAYALTFGGFLSFGARLGDVLNRRTILLAGLWIFSIASLLVGLASSQTMLIAMRALQGIGGALLAPATLALLMDYYSGPMLTRAISYYGATAGIGTSLGLIVGGIIASYSTWRAGFYLDMVMGVILIILTWRNVHPQQKTKVKTTMDWWGTITSIIGFSSLIYSINGTLYRNVAIGITVVALVGFVLIERRVKNPLMPLVIFKDNQRASALVSRFFMLGTSMSYFFLMPQALQKVFGITPLVAAVAFLPLTVVQFGVSLFVARLTFKFSNTVVLITGAIIDTFGLLLGAVIGIGQGYLLGVAVPMIFIGIGQGLIMSPLTIAGVANTTTDIAGAASGVVNTVHQIGGAVGLSIISVLVANIASPATMIDHAQMGMFVLAVIMLVAGLNILRSPHE